MSLCHLSAGDLFYVERGEGQPLLFLNGLAGDGLSWMGQLKFFAKHYHCIAVDNRDAGQSAYALAPYSISDLAQGIATLLRGLRLPPAHVVGVSMGGMIAQELALAVPELVLSLTLVNTLGRSDDWFRATLNAFEIIRRHVADTATFFEAILPWWVSPQFYADSGRISWLSWLLRQNPHAQRLDGFLRQLDAIRRHDALGKLAAICSPTLILAGEDDQVMPRRYNLELHSRLPHARRVLMPGVGHALPIENPGEFNRILAGFLMEQTPVHRQSA
jgi:pimeloyl-ACP methyl ester carboxylesterase